ncbi:hypothetical protein L1987_55662 [Smallanthus sonchifolius]|uniref:Uncharacterized protein n=1 Tax=Smallanthus sonchifolius TaxID=185202 RepID=A0ACB9EB74_9ASTR|nr:hypothetical protein L1987_55662 [Smallanthus sonchifolius]
MVSAAKIKSVDFFRKTPRDLTEASLSGAGISILAAISMIFLFGMELHSYLTVSTTTAIIIDKSSIEDTVRVDFNVSFPFLSCEFASVDVSDVLGTNRLNITKTIRKYSINRHFQTNGHEFRTGPVTYTIKHDEKVDDTYGEGSVTLTSRNFDKITHDDNNGIHIHETYYGDRDTDTLKMDSLVSSIGVDSVKHSISRSEDYIIIRPAPPQEGCRIEGFVWVKKVPGNLIISAASGSHSFDASQMNMSHVVSSLSFGSTITPMMMSDMKRLGPYLGAGHNRLNGQAYMTNLEDRGNVTIEHYLQVVKTEVLGLSHKLFENYEYTAHTSLIHAHSIPAAKFYLEFSPMQVLITENSKQFSHFITNLCAIIGGVFTVAGILDSILYNTYKLTRKVELGKIY